MSPESIAATLSIIRDIIVIGAAGGGVVIAGMGLRTWRQQLRGTTEYDVARRALKAAFKVREAVEYIRRLGTFLIEASGRDSEYRLSSEERRGLTDRWPRVSDAWSELHVEMLEAETLWGEDVTSIGEELWSALHRLSGAVYRDSMSVVDKRSGETLTAMEPLSKFLRLHIHR